MLCDPNKYDRVVVGISGGKDSLACVLHLIEQGVDPDKIELHHHLVDGAVDEDSFFDWPVTRAYCEAFARAFGLKLTFSWREGGLLREMMRNDAPTAPVAIPWPSTEGVVRLGGKGPVGTRLKYPQQTGNLAQRWCSSSAKIDCFARYLNNHEQFTKGTTLVVTGERAEESANRASYAEFEIHRSDLRNGLKIQRVIDHWRPVHQWSEQMVWDALKRWRVQPHPSYELGWSRCSCFGCVFNGKERWGVMAAIDPERFARFSAKETEFGVTIHRKKSLQEQVAEIKKLPQIDWRWVEVALSESWERPIFVDEGDWVLPSGAFAGSGDGP